MADAPTYAALTEIFRDVFMDDTMTLTPELTARHVAGWDSFKQIEIIIAIEEKYGVKFSTRELDRLQSVGDLANTLETKITT